MPCQNFAESCSPAVAWMFPHSPNSQVEIIPNVTVLDGGAFGRLLNHEGRVPPKWVCCLVAKLCLTVCDPWTVAHQAPLSMGFPRQEYWNVLPFSSPGDLPNPGIELVSPELAGRFFITEPPGKPQWA